MSSENPCNSGCRGTKDEIVHSPRKRPTLDSLDLENNLDREKIMKHSDLGYASQTSMQTEETPTRNPVELSHRRLYMSPDQGVGTSPSTLDDSLEESVEMTQTRNLPQNITKQEGENNQTVEPLDGSSRDESVNEEENHSDLVPVIYNPHPPEGVDIMVSIKHQRLVWQTTIDPVRA